MEASNEKRNARRFSDVHHSRKKGWRAWFNFLGKHGKTVNLKPPFYKRYPVVAGFIVVLAVVSVFGAKRLFTRAEVADFYPSNCLGSWQGPQNAQGKPEMLAPISTSTIFGEDNSAVFNSGTGQIFCGGFLPGNYASSSDIKSVGLTFVWQVGEPSATSTFPQGALITTSTISTSTSASADTATGTDQVTQVVGQGAALEQGSSTDVQQTAPADSSATTPADSGGAIPPQQINPEPVPPTNSSDTTSTTSFLYNLRGLLFNVAFAQSDSTSSPQVTSDTIPVANDTTTTVSKPQNISTPASPSPSNETTTVSEQVTQKAGQQTQSTKQGTQNIEQATTTGAEPSTTIIIGPTITASLTPLTTSTDASGTYVIMNATDTLATGTEPVVPPPAPDENFLKISYSTDGQTWTEIAKVNDNNWQNFTVTLPINNWEILKKLQIQVEGIPTTLNPTPKVYLDGMFAEVHYELSPEFAAALSGDQSLDGQNSSSSVTTTTIGGVTVIVLPPSQKPVSDNPKQQDTFRADQTPQFNFDLNSISVPGQ
ncbi:MAG: hypothetical protein KGJ89_01765 [Patescibacteria group bacterium]|nr:hypothetical protein [Patescibacteria group bacterium]MDE2015604.1 hypothetical protein [Patescibacteria group bacterium]MDE2226661.1 hypothetical protein [Patescibacteria group bacterium]